MRRRGFTLLEMVVAIVLFTVFITLAVQLFNVCNNIIGDANRETTQAGRANAALSTLRQDVWDARELREERPGILRLVRGDGRVVIWSVDEAGMVTRNEEPGQPRTWRELPVRMVLHVDGPTVVVTGREVRGKGRPVLTWRLASQVLLAGGGR